MLVCSTCPNWKMVKDLSEDLRWQVIYHWYIYGSSIKETQRRLFVSKRFVSNIRVLYERTKNVKHAVRRERQRVLSCEYQIVLLKFSKAFFSAIKTEGYLVALSLSTQIVAIP